MDRYLFQWEVEDYKDLPKGLCLMPGTGTVFIDAESYKESRKDFDNIIKCYMPGAKVIGRSYWKDKDMYTGEYLTDLIYRIGVQNPWPDDDPACEFLSDIFYINIVTYQLEPLQNFYDYKTNSTVRTVMNPNKTLTEIVYPK